MCSGAVLYIIFIPGTNIRLLRLSQNFSFWESNLGFRGKSGL
jgi:hypothetical protein